jgi:APA family basic amino acid/polyamine antiporter
MNDAGELGKHIGLRSAIALVVANVIGAGIFTTTGFQAADLGSPALIFILWAVGGLLAYCGALCYGELGAEMPQAGAEYVYLRETYGKIFGFISAFVSLIAGFPAPIAAALKSLVIYLSAFFPLLAQEIKIGGIISLNDLLAISIVWLLVAVQLFNVRAAIRFNNIATLAKVSGIVGIIFFGLTIGNGELANLGYTSSTYDSIRENGMMPAIATSLIFVMFCYSGWNAAAYVASEIIEPQKNLPRALLLGTLIVTVLYLGLNAMYFYGANVDELAGKVEVGLIASRALFGNVGAGLVTIVLTVSLLAASSAMTIAGPRVYYALGRDVHAFSFLAKTREGDAPVNALILQGVIASVLIVSGRVDQILQYAGFTLALMSALAVSCVIVLRIKKPELERPFRVWAYPLPPVLFLAVSLWTMYWAFMGRPVESLLALATVCAGGLLFYFVRNRDIAEAP